jgi:hypothetical protein
MKYGPGNGQDVAGHERDVVHGIVAQLLHRPGGLVELCPPPSPRTAAGKAAWLD